MKTTLHMALVMFALCILTGCMTVYNKPVGVAGGHPPPALPRPHPALIGMAFSGGGDRAAYLSAAILRQIHLQHIRVSAEPQTEYGDLLTQVDYLSSVSGGSLSATYFALHLQELEQAPADEPKGPWDRYFTDMSMNLRGQEWYLHTFSPLYWVKKIFTDYDRGNLARDDYDSVLYGGKTLQDLPDHPVLYINSFDVGDHMRFIFSKHKVNSRFFPIEVEQSSETGAYLDFLMENDLTLLGIDPASIKIADAVYASSAFPVAYPQLVLRRPTFGAPALRGPAFYLADGGLADNSGLLTLLSQMKAQLDDPQAKIVIGDDLPAPTEKRYVLAIYVDASLDEINPEESFVNNGLDDDARVERGTFIDSINSGFDMSEDHVMRYLQDMGVVIRTPRADFNTSGALTRGVDGDAHKADVSSWNGDLQRKAIGIRPYIIRLGFRDVDDTYFPRYGDRVPFANDPNVATLAKLANLKNQPPHFDDMIVELKQDMREIPTDFSLQPEDRPILDLVAYLLVNGVLVPELRCWDSIVLAQDHPGPLECPLDKGASSPSARP